MSASLLGIAQDDSNELYKVHYCGSPRGEPSELRYILRHTKTPTPSARKQSRNAKTQGGEFGMLEMVGPPYFLCFAISGLLWR